MLKVFFPLYKCIYLAQLYHIKNIDYFKYCTQLQKQLSILQRKCTPGKAKLKVQYEIYHR